MSSSSKQLQQGILRQSFTHEHVHRNLKLKRCIVHLCWHESQEMHRNAMDELQKAIAEVDQVRQRTLLEKETIEQEIERCNEAINKFQVRPKHFDGVC